MAAAVLSSALSLIQDLVTRPQFQSPSKDAVAIHHDLDKLNGSMLQIQHLAADMAKEEEENGKDETVRHWLRQLRGAAYDAEDLIDECRFQLLARSNTDNGAQMPPEEVHDPTHPPSQHGIAVRIRSLRERLDEIAKQRETLHWESCRELDAEAELPPPLLFNVDDSVVCGRDDDKREVIELLLANHRRDLSVIPIVGPGGVGKTALARLVYDDATIRDHFDARGWVYLSEDFDLIRLISAIVVSLTNMKHIYVEQDHGKPLNCQILRGKRFLLVLDNVQNENQTLWNSLRALLSVGLEGSAIVATTRSESVAKFMQTVLSYNLIPLPEEECQLLFEHHAFGSQNLTDNLNLVAIGKRITKKLKGMPLAAKMIGKLLCTEKNEEKWHAILQSGVWESTGLDGVVSSALRLSYYGLPTCLRVCFTYTALFPKGYLFKKDRLVQLWMAQGFIQPMGRKLPEDIGVEYFDELLRRSFFQQIGANEHVFTVHDLIHDLVQTIASKEISRIKNENFSFVTSEARHLSLCPEELGAFIRSCNRPRVLRTFLIVHRVLDTCDVDYVWSKACSPLSMPNDLFVGLKFLRTLDLSETPIVSLPESIDSVIHLRYLGLRHTKIRRLPESLCGLYNLQTLDLRDSEKLEELPKSITNVTNLRHLYLPRYVSIIPMPQGIGKLTNLQTLSTFYVDHGEQNCAIMELKDLVNLRGKFEIAGLHNVASVDYVEDALKDLRHIAKLILSSGNNYDYGNLGEFDFSLFDRVVEDNQSLSNVHDELQTSTENVVQVSVPKEICNGLETTVFDRLRPHTNLMELVVRSYDSLQFPNWMGDASFSNLTSVELDFCSKCEVLPPLGQLPLLRHLAFNELSGLENIGQEFCGHDDMIRIKGFPSLETLQFRSMYRWQEWSYVEDGSFPRLRHLELNYCPKLRRLPHILPSLVNLVIWHCPELMALPMLPSLTRLEGCCNEMIWSSMPQDLISRLQDLSICESEDLASLPLENLHAIREFNISSCQQNTSHVAFLELHLLNLVFLKRFKIRRCPGIWFSPNHKLPPALQVLEILNCPLLEEWCHGHGSNELVHISRVIVDQKDFHLVAAERTKDADQGIYEDS
ncbi:putative disease resistance RPP13-like protein 1 isoform X1 [Musa acuminata AAA Group]|uniref:putative disease resistance RPP13-like protein 1 isoform X1 n=1 Tax=Musa acuminata AAA Group TaxID=214697 RepID=UPI0031D9850C